MPIPVEVYDFGEDMALVYEWCANRVLTNIARRFPFVTDEEARGVFEWQAKKLVEFGQCNQENMQIIRDSLKGVPDELARTLEEQITKSVEKVEPELVGAAKAGLLPGAGVQPMSQSVKQSFEAYYGQAANKLNLVNTVMLDSTQQAYTGVVTDVVTKITNSQRYLNDAAGSVITGVETVNTAMRQAVNRMVENGLTGFVDHAGRRWTPEAYVQMDIRTTVANASRQAAFDRCDEFGSDIIQIDAHAGARPLCYPWQGKLISRSDNARDVTDLYGTTVHVYALSETSYGEAAGLFGVNCRHFGTPFIPGFSGLMNKELIQPKEENDKRYEATQEQRYLERQIRDARLKESIAKARGDEEEAKKARQRVTELSDRIEEFCESNGLPRRRDREYTPVNATWPGKTGPLPYNVQPFKGNAGNGAVTSATDFFDSKQKNVFVPASSLEEAKQRAETAGVKYAVFGDMSLERVNNALEALETLPQNARPIAIASGKNTSIIVGRSLGRRSDQWYGVTYDYRPFTLNVKQLGYETNLEGGVVVGLNTQKFKTLAQLTAAKEKTQSEYLAKTGRNWFFNTDGRASAFHEMGHVYADILGLPAQWETLSKRWAEESKCDMLNSPSEAFAEAWGAYYTNGRELPGYIRDVIEGLR